MGKTALITGATSGIGAAFARKYASLGYDLMITGRRVEKINQLAEDIREKNGVKVDVIIAELSNEDDVTALIDKVKNEEIHILINNAGFGYNSFFHKGDIKIYKNMVDVHVLTPVRLIHAILPQMIGRASGTIINVSSEGVFLIIPKNAVYTGTKSFLKSFTEALYLDVTGTGVKVQALCPGLTRTDLHEKMGMSKTRQVNRGFIKWMALVHFLNIRTKINLLTIYCIGNTNYSHKYYHEELRYPMEEKFMSPLRTSDLIEKKLIRSILSGEFQPGSELPPERDLAVKLDVGRPTLREVIQRLERDGWFTVRKGQHTLVNDFWREGNLNTLVNLVQNSEEVPEEFIINLLEVRAVLAPAYVKDAVNCCPAKVVAALTEIDDLNKDTAEVFALFDWQLQKKFVNLAQNPIYQLILNSFDAIYIRVARHFFMVSENRQLSRQFYQDLLARAMALDYLGAEKLTKEVMEQVLRCYLNQIK